MLHAKRRSLHINLQEMEDFLERQSYNGEERIRPERESGAMLYAKRRSLHINLQEI